MYRILGHVVRQLRYMAVADTSVVEMMRYLVDRTDDNFYMLKYLSEAFGISLTILMSLPPTPVPDDKTDLVDRMIRRNRSTWDSQHFAELMRVRDYDAFTRFAKSESLVVAVLNANHHSGPLIDRPGFRCYDGDQHVITRETSPNEGMVAADPDDPRLLRSLQDHHTPLTYNMYVERLAREGHRVLGRDDGYVVADNHGNRFFEAYRLHGVYDANSRTPVWSGKRGEDLRRTINRLLGSELIRSGPHDEWEHRNDRDTAGPLCGPHAPLLEFNSKGHLRHIHDLGQLARSGNYQSVHWSRLYPLHAHLLADSGGDQ